MSGLEPDPIPQPQLSPVLEQVQFASSIQPYGVLLVLRDSDLTVLQASANLQEHFGISAQDSLGQPLALLLSQEAVSLIERELAQLYCCNGAGRTKAGLWIEKERISGTIYRQSGRILLELEPAQPETRSRQPQFRQAVAELRQVADLKEFLQRAALEVRRLTEFDRVMIYQFDAQGAGEVVAEAKRPDLPPYLGLHYPATDIPSPVRELYRQGMVRYIPDLNAPAVELISGLPNSSPDRALDLSESMLRGVDACCVEYHQNMAVAAILVLALTQGETLWGLISCHHQTPKPVVASVREDCELLAQLVASELAHKVNREELHYLTKLRSLQSEFIQSIAQASDLKQALVQPGPRLLDLVGAEGAAVCLEDEITLVGNCPTGEQVAALLTWTEQAQFDFLDPHRPLFYTDSLPKLYPDAAAFKDRASGLLVLRISQVRRYTILWFRPEVLQTVNWAGDPKASLTLAADGSLTLCPRQSFEQWQQIVQFTSLPWKASELENALDLRSAIVGIVLKKADELARVNQELERSIRELDSFAYAASHDLKEPLRGIHNFSNLLLKGYSSVIDEAGQARLHTLVRLTRRMESLIDALLKFSRLGQAELHQQPVDLNQSLQQVLEDLRVGHPDLATEIRIPRPLPTVDCDPILIQEVLVNLISNAIKYNDKPQSWVEIGYLAGSEKSERHESNGGGAGPIFYVRDNGIGIRERHLGSVFRLFKRLHEQHLYGGGTGAGLTIAKKIIERHGGQIWIESSYGQGSTFYFTLR